MIELLFRGVAWVIVVLLFAYFLLGLSAIFFTTGEIEGNQRKGKKDE